jgi:hypothetical protein
VDLRFDGEIVHWRGPAPFLFVPVPAPECAEIAAVAPMVTYGWGCIPAAVTIGRTSFTTSLFPKAGGYMVPVKVAVQRAEGIGLGDPVDVRLSIEVR